MTDEVKKFSATISGGEMFISDLAMPKKDVHNSDQKQRPATSREETPQKVDNFEAYLRPLESFKDPSAQKTSPQSPKSKKIMIEIRPKRQKTKSRTPIQEQTTNSRVKSRNILPVTKTSERPHTSTLLPPHHPDTQSEMAVKPKTQRKKKQASESETDFSKRLATYRTDQKLFYAREEVCQLIEDFEFEIVRLRQEMQFLQDKEVLLDRRRSRYFDSKERVGSKGREGSIDKGKEKMHELMGEIQNMKHERNIYQGRYEELNEEMVEVKTGFEKANELLRQSNYSFLLFLSLYKEMEDLVEKSL